MKALSRDNFPYLTKSLTSMPLEKSPWKVENTSLLVAMAIIVTSPVSPNDFSRSGWAPCILHMNLL